MIELEVLQDLFNTHDLPGKPSGSQPDQDEPHGVHRETGSHASKLRSSFSDSLLEILPGVPGTFSQVLRCLTGRAGNFAEFFPGDPLFGIEVGERPAPLGFGSLRVSGVTERFVVVVSLALHVLGTLSLANSE
jgi:hypothetical protein